MRYSSEVLEHFSTPKNAGRLDDANAVGRAGEPGQGNYVVLQLRIEGSRIARVAFQSFGCPAAIASGSVTTELVSGKTVAEASRVTGQEILDALGGLPPGRTHCADLAVSALKDALSHYAAT
jgi:nitrogen fixation NifU-like protein